MDLFGRYVFRQVAGSFLLIVLTLTLIVWLATALSQLDLLTSQGQSFLLFLQMTSLALPNLIALISPIALLLACLHTLDRLNADSELIVMTSSGTNLWRISTPFLALASIVTVALVVLNLYLSPLSMRTLRSYVTQVRTDLISQVLQPGRFSSPEAGLTFHIRDRDLSGELKGLVVHDQREPTQVMSYLAKTGQILKREDGSFLVMRNGHIHRYDASKADKAVQIVAFDQYIFDLSQFGPKTGATILKPRERYLDELTSPDPDDPLFKRFPGKFRSELHNRFATPFYPLAYALIALAILGRARTVRENRWSSIFLAFGLAVGVRVTGLASTNLLTLDPSAVVLVYGVPITAIGVALLAAQVRMTPRIRFGGRAA
ncbi:MAG: LPS export ABC transporter permease LptF [Hyphomicrobiales bacterium]|nr:LPS export ABC transporter permease LptF [Hyphomicrobiales bacterium]